MVSGKSQDTSSMGCRAMAELRPAKIHPGTRDEANFGARRQTPRRQGALGGNGNIAILGPRRTARNITRDLRGTAPTDDARVLA